MSAEITIELPDLPEPFGEFYSDDRCDTLPDVYTADQMHAYAAEALRQSQSLPAGAVAGLLADWREREHRFHGMGGQYVAEKLADELEQAILLDKVAE